MGSEAVHREETRRQPIGPILQGGVELAAGVLAFDQVEAARGGERIGRVRRIGRMGRMGIMGRMGRTAQDAEPPYVHPPQFCYGGRVGCYDPITAK